jgi:hypothetical protein
MPLAVGFGISTPEIVNRVANMADGVVVGSAILNAMDKLGDDATTAQRVDALRDITSHLVTGSSKPKSLKTSAPSLIKFPKNGLMRIRILDPSDQIVEFDFSFSADSTGQSGVTHMGVVKAEINYGPV